MKTVYIVYYSAYDSSGEEYRSVDAIFESLDDAKTYVNKQHTPSAHEIEEFNEYYEKGYKI